MQVLWNPTIVLCHISDNNLACNKHQMIIHMTISELYNLMSECLPAAWYMIRWLKLLQPGADPMTASPWHGLVPAG